MGVFSRNFGTFFQVSKKFFTVQSGWTTSNRVILQQLCRKTWHLTWWMTQSKRHNKTKDFWWKMYLIILEKELLPKWNKKLFPFLINKAIHTLLFIINNPICKLSNFCAPKTKNKCMRFVVILHYISLAKIFD